MSKIIIPEVLNSPSFGQLDWEKTLLKMVSFIETDLLGSYEIIIGTDSEAQNGEADFVSALIVHKKGRGGVYFWGRQKIANLVSLKQRIWQEALISLSVAEKLVGDFKEIGFFDPSVDQSRLKQEDGTFRLSNEDKVLEGNPKIDLNLEIHVDIGPNGPTRELISDIVGMIRANGFKVATKPTSWGASHVADRHV